MSRGQSSRGVALQDQRPPPSVTPAQPQLVQSALKTLVDRRERFMYIYGDRTPRFWRDSPALKLTALAFRPYI